MSTQRKGNIDDSETKPDIKFVDVTGKTRNVPSGRFIDFNPVNNIVDQAGFSATPMSKVSLRENTHPIELSNNSPRRK